jgi:hypothetical protein
MSMALISLLISVSLAFAGAFPNKTPAEARGAYPRKHLLWDLIDRPWQGPLTQIRSHLPKGRSFLSWHMIPAAYPLDLRTAENFRRFVIATPLDTLTISHNMVGWRCVSPQGKVVEGATGSTGEADYQSKDLFQGGYGLTTFFAIFTDGTLNTSRDVSALLEENDSTLGFLGLTQEVSFEQCLQARSFVRSFALHPREPYRNFGLTPRPENYEGAGCVTFAMAVLAKAGVLKEVLPLFRRQIRATSFLMGGNLENLPHSTKVPTLAWLEGRPKHVSFGRLWTETWDPWPTETNAPLLSVLDPELMSFSLRTLALAAVGASQSSLTSIERSEFRERTIIAGDNGDRSLKLKTYPIRLGWDPQGDQVASATKGYWRKLKNSGAKASLIPVMRQQHLLILND